MSIMKQYINALLSNPEFFKNVVQRYGAHGSIGMPELATAISNLESSLEEKLSKKEFEVEGFMKVPSDCPPVPASEVVKVLKLSGYRKVLDSDAVLTPRETWIYKGYLVRLDIRGEDGHCQVGYISDEYGETVDYAGVIKWVKEKGR